LALLDVFGVIFGLVVCSQVKQWNVICLVDAVRVAKSSRVEFIAPTTISFGVPWLDSAGEDFAPALSFAKLPFFSGFFVLDSDVSNFFGRSVVT
jgi:hypothetical protein